MTTLPPKPNRRARQIAVSDSVALVLCEDDSLWAYDLLVKVAEWERLPAIPVARPKPVEVSAMDAETGEDIQPSPKPDKPPAKPKRLKPHPNAAPDATTA